MSFNIASMIHIILSIFEDWAEQFFFIFSESLRLCRGTVAVILELNRPSENASEDGSDSPYFVEGKGIKNWYFLS